MKNYDIHHIGNEYMKLPASELLEILVEVADSNSLAEAGAKLNISQPAVSVKLKQLESETPLPLFSVEGKRKVLTHYGRELCRIAKANQNQMAHAFDDLNRQYATAEHLTLKVGSRRELFEAIAETLEFPGRLAFMALSNKAAVESLLANKIDIAISYEIPDSAEIMAKKIRESGCKLVVHRKFVKLKVRDALLLDKEFFLQTPCILYQNDGHLLKDWLMHLKLRIDQLRVKAVSDDWRTIQILVDKGWGYGIVPDYIESTCRDVISIPIPTAILPKFTFYALFHAHLKKVPAFKKVLEFKI